MPSFESAGMALGLADVTVIIDHPQQGRIELHGIRGVVALDVDYDDPVEFFDSTYLLSTYESHPQALNIGITHLTYNSKHIMYTMLTSPAGAELPGNRVEEETEKLWQAVAAKADAAAYAARRSGATASRIVREAVQAALRAAIANKLVVRTRHHDGQD